MRIIEEIIVAIDPTGANIVVESHIEDLSKGEGDSKIIIEANIKATIDNLILPMVAITIITMAIIEVQVALAVVVTFITTWSRKRQLQRPEQLSIPSILHA